MARIIEPFWSDAAAGTLAHLITYYRTPHGHAAHARGRPRYTETGLQRAIRLIMPAMARDWHLLSVPASVTWDGLADQNATTCYHAFLSYNMRRWRTFKPPTQAYPPAETGTNPTVMSWTRSSGKGYVNHEINVQTLNSLWTLSMHRATAYFGPATLPKTSRLLTIHAPGYLRWSEQGLAPGTYYYRYRCGSTSGKTLQTSLPAVAVVT
jgi:hypothetical protein